MVRVSDHIRSIVEGDRTPTAGWQVTQSCFYHKYLSHVQMIADLKIVIIYSQEVQD